MKEGNLKKAAMVLAAAIGLGFILIIAAAVHRGAGSLHPSENDSAVKWENFTDGQDYEDVTTNPEGFTVQEGGT